MKKEIKIALTAVVAVVLCFQNYGAGDIIELDNADMVSFIGATVDMENKIVVVK